MNNIIILQTFTTRMEADIAKSFLQSNGIETYIQADDEGRNFFDRAYGNGVMLMIQEKNVKEAKKLLEKIT